jgi:hypothetical protein
MLSKLEDRRKDLIIIERNFDIADADDTNMFTVAHARKKCGDSFVINYFLARSCMHQELSLRVIDAPFVSKLEAIKGYIDENEIFNSSWSDSTRNSNIGKCIIPKNGQWVHNVNNAKKKIDDVKTLYERDQDALSHLHIH